MDQNNTRNTIVFTVCAVALLMLYQAFVMGPIAKRRQAEMQAHQAAVAAQPIQMAAPGSSIFVSREQAVAGSPRVQIDTPALQGSLALKGGRHRRPLPEGLPRDPGQELPAGGAVSARGRQERLLLR